MREKPKGDDDHMRTHVKKGTGALLALCLCLSLTACGSGVSKFDVTTYMNGLLQATYLGQADEAYLELVGTDEAHIQESYEAGLESEVHVFLEAYDIEYPTDELEEDLKELYDQVYQHTKYTVVSAAEQDDGSFSVKVEVEPIDIVQLVNGEWDKTTEKFYEKYPSEVQRAMSRSEYQAMDKEWAALILKAFQDKLPEIGNMTPQSIVVSLEKDEDGYYSLNEKDFAALDALIIDYTSTIGGKS